MDALELQILNKRQELRDLLQFSLRQSPVYLPVVRSIKFDISICNAALKQLHSWRSTARLG